jgi:hypothetical protein
VRTTPFAATVSTRVIACNEQAPSNGSFMVNTQGLRTHRKPVQG